MKILYRIVLSALLVIIPYLSSAQIVVEMKQIGNVYSIPGKINGLDLNFIFDTGASDVSISLTEAIFMLKHGYLKQSDIQGISYSQIANGDIVENTNVLLREVEVAGVKITNVTASISHSTTAPLLLGMSAIKKIGPIQIDGNKLIIQNGKNFKSDEKAMECYHKGFQLIEAELYEEAIPILQEGLKYGVASNIRSNLHQELALAYSNLGKYEIAVRYCYNGLGENPQNHVLGYNLGVLLYDNNDYEQAEKAFKQVISKMETTHNLNNDILYSSYGYLGCIQLSKQEYVNAENSFQRSLKITPNSLAFLGLGDVYREQEDYAKSVEYYEKGILYEPHRLSNIKRYYQLGMVSVKAGFIDKAKEAFNKCKTTCEENGALIAAAAASEDESFKESAYEFIYYSLESYLWLGRIASSSEERIIAYNKAITHVPSSMVQSMDYINMCASYMDLGDRNKAYEIITVGQSAYPNDIDILFVKSRTIDDKTKEVEILMQILNFEYKVQPRFFDYATVYNNIAWNYCCIGKFEEGLVYAEKAIARNKSHDYIWETLGELYYNTGNYEKCIDAMTQCIGCSNNNNIIQSALSFRGKSHLKLGNNKQGKIDLKAADRM